MKVATSILFVTFTCLRALSPLGARSQPTVPTSLEADTRDRISRLNARFKEFKGTASWQTSRDDLARQIHEVIDDFIAHSVDPRRFARNTVEESLRRAIPQDAISDAPVVFATAPSNRPRRLTVAYSLASGGTHGSGATSATIRVYGSSGDHFAKAAATPKDMDGYMSIVTKELKCPITAELCFLTWGQMSGANGPNMRMRLYTYDGKAFRTVWMPANVWGEFTVTTDGDRFRLKIDYYRASSPSTDEYVLTDDGVYRFPK